MSPTDKPATPEPECGALGMCEQPKGHGGLHSTSVARAIAATPEHVHEFRDETRMLLGQNFAVRACECGQVEAPPAATPEPAAPTVHSAPLDVTPVASSDADVTPEPAALDVEGLGRLRRVVESETWWTDGAMVNGGLPGDEHFVADAASPDDAERLVEQHNAALTTALREVTP